MEPRVNVAQQIVALDTQYSSLRSLASQQYKLLYLKRRNQLLQEKERTCTDSTVRKHYLQLRAQILAGRYGNADRRSNRSGGSRRGSAKQSLRQSMESLPRAADISYLVTPTHRSAPLLGTGLVPTRVAQASRAMAGDISLSEHYAFCGMHHIFDKHRDAVTVIKFANDDRSSLACASRDGILSVFSLVSEPPSLVSTLQGHSSAINDLDWSVSNDFIVSASSDGTCRLWESTSGQCLRVVPGTSGCQILCCRFHNFNSNLLLTGNSKGQIQVYNLSTGKAVKGGSSKAAGSVLCITLEPNGNVLWAADSKGSLFSFLINGTSGRLQRHKRVMVVQGIPIDSICCRTWISREARDPSLLLSCADNTLRLYRIMADGTVYLKRKFTVAHTSHPIRSAFSPQMSFLQGACIISGSEDGRVYLFDVETGAEVNTLSGHSCPVLDVSWNYDESFLASCDAQGTIIVWKRSPRQQSD